MNEILKEYYGLEVEYYRFYNDGLIFFVNGDYYYLCKTIFNEVEIEKSYTLYNLLKKANVFLHDFIFNNNGELKSGEYVLFKLNYIIDDIDLSDLNKMQIIINYDVVDNFYLLWTSKLDYLEKQLVDLSENTIINYSFDYFLGIAEMLLCFYRDNFDKVNDKYVVHRSFYNLSTIDFYNPLNIVLGDRYKDFASYIRITNDWNLMYNLVDSLDYKDRVGLFIRLAFPFYYFKLVNNYLTDGEDENKIIKLVNDIDNYEEYLWKLEKVFGINLFYFIKKDN